MYLICVKGSAVLIIKDLLNIYYVQGTANNR